MFIATTFIGERTARSVSMLLLSVGVWLLGGLLFGALVWYFSERRYHRLVPRSSDDGRVQAE